MNNEFKNAVSFVSALLNMIVIANVAFGIFTGEWSLFWGIGVMLYKGASGPAWAMMAVEMILGAGAGGYAAYTYLQNTN
jgi:hypothetical protein